MVRYRRNFIAGGTYFFTVTLADRTSSALVDNMSALRMAFRIARRGVQIASSGCWPK
jgi:putative transposase